MPEYYTLLVCNDGEVAERIRGGLQSVPSGLAVTVAGTAAGCIEHLGDNSAGCVVSCIELPDMDGYALSEKLGELYPWLPVVLLSEDNQTNKPCSGVVDGARAVISVGDASGSPALLGLAVKSAVRHMRAEKRIAETEKALHDERGRLYGILDSIGDGIVLQDRDWKVTFQNKASIDLIGLHKGEDCFRAFESREEVCETCPILDSFRDGGVHREEKLTHTPHGEQFVELTGSALRDEKGNITGGVKVVRNITERRRLERQRAELIEMVTHDMKTPLTTMMAYMELILTDKKETVGPEVLGMVNAVRQSSNKMLKMVDDFLALSRMEAGDVQLVRGPVELSLLLDEIRGMFHGVAEKKGVEVVLETEPGQPSVSADRELLERAVSNLVKNALEHTPAGGRVVVRAGMHEEGGGMAAISVTDTGPGVSAGERARIFEKYYRGSNSMSSRGAGLGLAIVKAVAEAHGGTVGIKCCESGGCTFTLRIPADGPGSNG